MITGRTRVFALLGDPVAHSVSPAMQNAALAALGLDAVYVPMRCAAADVPVLMRTLAASGGGGNVTLPHKVVAAATVDPTGTLPLGTVNTFWAEDGTLHGESTDIIGVREGMAALGAPAAPWLVLGTGGTARAALWAAKERGVAIAVRSRSPERARALEAQAQAMGVAIATEAECSIAINATPLGLGAADPLPMAPAPHLRWALDMVYHPGETAWVRAMRAAGAQALDGRVVLLAQGAAGLRRWFPGVEPPLEIMRAALQRALG